MLKKIVSVLVLTAPFRERVCRLALNDRPLARSPEWNATTDSMGRKADTALATEPPPPSEVDPVIERQFRP